MVDIVIMLLVLAAGFAAGSWLGHKRADEQLKGATKRLEAAIDIVKAFHAHQVAPVASGIDIDQKGTHGEAQTQGSA